MTDSGAARIGYMIGVFILLFAVSSLVLFVNRNRKQNPTPYLAAGLICAILAIPNALNNSPGSSLLALFALWLILLWRYKLASNAQATKTGRVNAVWLGFIAVLGLLGLIYSVDESVPAFCASIGLASIGVGTLAKWVMLAPKRA